MKKQEEQKETIFAQKWEEHFPIWEYIRLQPLPGLLIFLVKAIPFFFYIVPLLSAVLLKFKVQSRTTSLIAYFNDVLEVTKSLLANKIIAGIYIGIFAMLITIVGVLRFIVDFSTNPSKQGEYLKKTFAILMYGFFILLYPLSHGLTLITEIHILFPPLSILSFICLIICAILAYVMQVFLICSDFSKETQLGKMYYKHDGEVAVGKLILSCLFCLSFSQYIIYVLIILLLALIITTYQLHQVIFSVRLYRKRSQQFKMLRVIANMVLVLECFGLFAVPWNIFRNNLDLFQVVLFLFIYFSASTFMKQRNQNLVLASIDQIENQSTAIIYAYQLTKISLERQTLDMAKLFLIRRHLKECKNPTCFCENYPNLEIYDLAGHSTFVNKLILSILEELKAKFYKSIWILVLFLNFKLTENPNFSKISQMVKHLREKNKLRIHQRYVIYQLQKMVDEQIKEISSNRQNLPLERVIKEAERQYSLKKLLETIVEQITKKYKLMASELVRLNQLSDYCDSIHLKIRQIQQVIKQHSKVRSFNVELDLLILAYYDKIVPSLIEAKSQKIQVEDKIKKLVSIQGMYLKNMDLAIYSEKACVIESIFDDNYGVVTNVSNSVTTVLGVQRSRVIGQNIHKLMPSYFAKGHEQAMKLCLMGDSLIIHKKGVSDCYYQNMKGQTFKSLVYMKLFSLQGTVKVYKIVVRDNDQDIVILNRQKKIQGVGNRIIELGALSPEDRHKQFNDFILPDLEGQTPKLDGKEDILFSSTSCANQHLTRKFIEEGIYSHKKFFQCKLNKEKRTVGNMEYYIIHFLEIRQIELTLALLDQSHKHSKQKTIVANAKKVDQQFSEEKSSARKFSNSNMSSILDSSATVRFSYNKILLVLKKMITSPNQIVVKWQNCVLISSLLILIITCSLFISVGFLFQYGFSSFNEVLFADGAVSDNNQILEIMYNNILMSKTYCGVAGWEDRCDYILKSNNLILQKYYDLYQSDIRQYFNNVTTLSKLRYYQSYQIPVNLTIGNSSIQITTLQFMEYFYSSLKSTQFEFSSTASLSSNQAIQFLFDNWQSMKKVNHQAIEFYLSAANDELQILIQLMIAILVLIVLSCLAFFLILKLYFDHKDSRKSRLLDQYKNITRKMAYSFFNYYDKLKSTPLTNIHHLPYPEVKCEGGHQGITSYQSPSKKKYYFVLLQIAACMILFSVGFISILNMFPPSKNMSKSINLLMDSQNYLLENYIELKTFYLGFNFNKTEEQINQEILTHLNQTEVQFGKIARGAVTLFANTDPTFVQEFNRVITESVCELTAEKFQKWQVQYCRNGTHYETLQKGIMAGMYFLQRSTMEALIELRDSPSLNKTDYFKGKVFQDLDDYLFFMFRIYEMTQNRMYTGLTHSIADTMSLITVVDCLILLLAISDSIFRLSERKKEKEQVSFLYGYVLQLPESVLTRKHVLNDIESVLFLK